MSTKAGSSNSMMIVAIAEFISLNSLPNVRACHPATGGHPTTWGLGLNFRGNYVRRLVS